VKELYGSGVVGFSKVLSVPEAKPLTQTHIFS
jgi:hypothetical protein